MDDNYKVCIDCGDLTTGTRCQPCQATRDQRVNQRRAEMGTLGAPWSWRATSRAVRRRQPACTVCGTTQDLTVDHIEPRTAGGSDDLANLTTLCRRHNSAKGGRR